LDKSDDPNYNVWWLQIFNEAMLFFFFAKNMGYTLLHKRTNFEFSLTLEKSATEIYKLKANREKGRHETKGLQNGG
jgi:hypothetical protein